MSVDFTLKAAGGDYTLITQFDATEQSNFEAQSESYRLLCDGVDIVDNNIYFFWGTTTSTKRVILEAAQGVQTGVSRYDGGTGFIARNTAANTGIRFGGTGCNYDVIGLEFAQEQPSSGNTMMVTPTSMGASDYLFFKNCITRFRPGTSGTVYGISANDATDINDLRVENHLHISDAGSTSTRAMLLSTVKSTIDNVTAVTFETTTPGSRGITGTATSTARNCVVVGYSSEDMRTVDGAGTTNNATGDTSVDGSNGQTGVVLTAGVDFVDAANGDFTPVDGGKLKGLGTSPPELPTDIAGNPRNDPDDIGAYAVVASGPNIKTLKSSGGDYSLMSQWEADASTQFDGAAPWVLDCYTFVGTQENVTMASWATSPTQAASVTIKNADGELHGFEHRSGNNGNALTIQVPWVTVKGIKITNFATYGDRMAVNFASQFGNNGTIDSCYVSLDASSVTANYHAIAVGYNGAADLTIINNEIECAGSASTSSAPFYFAHQYVKNDAQFYNNTCVGFESGVANSVNGGATSEAPLTSYNNIFYGITDTTQADNQTADYNATDQSSGLDGSNNVYNLTTADFVDYAGGDYTPSASGALAGAGTSPPLLALDITGATRNDPDDIGAYVAAGGPILVKEMYVKDSNAFVNAAPNLRIGGAWQEVEAHVRSGGVWVKVHDK